MAVPKRVGSGWHKQSVRHSNAKRLGRAGGSYSVNNHKVLLSKNKSGLVEVKGIQGKYGKKIVSEDLKRGGWHFGRKYDTYQHAKDVTKPVVTEYLRDYKTPWRRELNLTYYIKYKNKKDDKLLLLEAVAKDSLREYHPPKWQVSVGGSVSRVLIGEYHGKDAKQKAIDKAEEYMRKK